MVRNKFLKTTAVIRLLFAAGAFSVGAGIFAATPALAGTGCTLGVCGIVDSYVWWSIPIARDSQSHFYCKNPYSGPVKSLPAWGRSDRSPINWKDTDCFYNGIYWERIWAYKAVFP
jgi:hypothetical protein